MSYFVYSQSIGEEWWELSIIFSVLISTKGTEESSALDSIIIDLIKTCSFCTQINFSVIRWWCIHGITIWFARRWDCNTPVEMHQFYDCQWINLYKCILTHYSMVTPINIITYPHVLDLFYYILLVSAPFHQSLVRERQLIFHLSGINAAINHY